MTLHSMSSLSGSEIPLDGLTILVGPNNAGKSQTLRDIHQLITVPAAPTVLVASLDDRFVKSKESYLRGVSKRPSKNNPINTAYSALDSSLQSLKSLEITEETLDAQFNNETWDWINTQFGTYRLAYLNAGSRLDVAKSGLSHDAHTEDPSTLLQQLYLRKDIQHELDLAFHQTFGMHVKLDYSGLKTLSLRVGYEFGDVPSDPSEAHPIMGKFPQLDVQGDGFRSFVGVVLSLLLSRNRIILLDEPEAFLHPEQARRLGRWLATDSAQYGGQVIVATHNSHFIQGLLSVNSSTRLVRLNRTGDCTSYRVVDTSTTKEFASSPLLSSQRVLEAVFHRKTVVCEADTDRMIYQTVALREFGQSDILFVNAQNKQTCHSIASTLRSAGVDVSVIVDLDVLNSELDLRHLMQSFGIDVHLIEQFESARLLIAAEVNGREEAEVLQEISAHVTELVGQLQCGEHTLNGARSALARIRSAGTKWDRIKGEGISALSEGIRRSARDLLNALGEHRIYLVPVGELESWMNLAARKNRWSNVALDEISDGRSTEPLRRFVGVVIGAVEGELVPSQDDPDHNPTS